MDSGKLNATEDPDAHIIAAIEREARLELLLQGGSRRLAWLDTGIAAAMITALATLSFLVTDMVVFAGRLEP